MTQHFTRRYAPFLLLLALILPSCSEKSTLERGAERMAQAYWHGLFTVCSDSYVITQGTLNRHASQGYTEEMLAANKDRDGFNPLTTYQYRGVTILVIKSPDPIDFTEELFKTKWKGKTSLLYKQVRVYSPSKGEWSAWEERDGGYSVKMFQQEGRWQLHGLNRGIIDDDRLTKVLGDVAKINCDNIK